MHHIFLIQSCWWIFRLLPCLDCCKYCFCEQWGILFPHNLSTSYNLCPQIRVAENSASVILSSVQYSSVAQSCPTLCDPMNHSMPGLPVHHQLPAAAAKSLQSCPTLCDPTDSNPPGSPVPGILQARTLEWVAISFSNAWKWKVKGKLLSHIRLLATPWTAAYQAPPPMGFSRQEYWSGVPLPSLITNSQSLPKPMSIELVMPSNHLILCCPLLLPPSIFPSIRVFSNESVLHVRWPKYWSFSIYISHSNEHSGLISFRMDWLGLLAVQGTLKSLLQHHGSKASILRCLAFFIVQLSHPYTATGKTIALMRWTFVDKVMSLLFNMLSRLVITFLPRSKRLLISWLQAPSAVILEPQKIRSATISTVSPYICHEVMGLDAMILVFWMLSFKPTFSLSSFIFIKRLFSFHFLP